MSQPQAKWQKLPSFPFTYFPPPIFINKEEFIICPSRHVTCQSDGIYLFNTRKTEWKKIFDFPKEFRCFAHSTAYDKSNNTLYVSRSTKQLLFSVDLNHERLNEFSNTRTFVTAFDYSKLIFIDNELHYMDRDKFLVYDISRCSVKNSLEQKDWMIQSIVYLKSQKCILFINRFDGDIYKFSMLDKKCEKLSNVGVETLVDTVMLSTRDERYVILFGGIHENDFDDNVDDIHIYDMKDQTLRASKLKCPFKGDCRAVISGTSDEEEMITNGFIKNCYKQKEFIDVMLLPHYLIKLIARRYQNERVYLLKHGHRRCHFTIKVDDILQ